MSETTLIQESPQPDPQPEMRKKLTVCIDLTDSSDDKVQKLCVALRSFSQHLDNLGLPYRWVNGLTDFIQGKLA
mgnify:CR=1 FL=1